ncbi:hypothetical protein ASE03_28015 [Kitasatospora sp. Root187]|uniref:phosphotransferase family protein n=1 Tax=Kitasatospora sp. Root187 TaxID=1736486 RepID=UPI00070A802B|nr:aminoglycoside phosphotransferase family protein [Kitasatospora sp. Root187]KRB69281.1 hypothetical protein ASE03_28015 [Kitasatospora sp. Root187]
MSERRDPITVRHALPGLLVSPPRRLSAPVAGLRARRLARQLGPHDPPVLHRPPLGFSDVLVLRWDGADGRSLAVKHPRTPRALAAVTRERDVLRQLGGDERLRGWHRLLPETVESRLDGPLPMLLQSWLPGTAAGDLLQGRPQDAGRITRLSLAAVSELHRATGRLEDVGDRIDGWTGPRSAVLASRLCWCRTGAGAAGLAAVQHRLREGLACRPMLVAWTHGDFAPDNVLLDEDGERVTGLVDWADADPAGPSEVDPCTFALGLRWLLDGRSWGGQVVNALRTGSLRVEELGEDQPSDIVLLAWLWHVSANLGKSWRFARNRAWLRSVVVPVLEEAASWS